MKRQYCDYCESEIHEDSEKLIEVKEIDPNIWGTMMGEGLFCSRNCLVSYFSESQQKGGTDNGNRNE